MLAAIHPVIPYEGPISGTVQNGFCLYINGIAPSGYNSSFAINLATAMKRPGYPEPNIAFHFNPRLGENVVVRNTYQSTTGWGPEERSGVMPFNRGTGFQLQIYAEPYEFKVLVNGYFFCEYKYRIPLHQIKALSITGEVAIQQISSQVPCQSRNKLRAGRQHGGATAPPPPYTPYPSPFPQQQYVPQKQGSSFPMFINNPSVPVTVNIPGCVRPGMNFSITGVPPSSADRFSINWKCPNGDTAFHFNPRFKENVVVRNTLQMSNWGPEERSQSKFPFAKNTSFHIHVQCQHNYYDVKVNGSPFAVYNHRIYPINTANMLTIEGNVVITTIGISL